MLLLKRLCQTALFSLVLLCPFSCKKNPITPSTDDLLRPVIWLNTFELSFAAYESGGNPAEQVFKIKNSGKNTLQYTISDDADWISVEPGTGSSSGQLVEHTILINKTGLAARDAGYEATITVVSPEAYNNPQRLHVSLKISTQPPPVIWVSPSEMMFAAKVGKNPSAQTLRVKNTGEGTLTYDITWDASWLNVAPSGGSSGGEEASHTVSVHSKNLPEGSYDGSITISSPDASNSPQRVSVSLDVSTAPSIPTDNRISISCNPNSGGTGTLVSIPISIRGNIQSISTFGLVLTFDSNMFQYQSTRAGSLTGSWAMVDGNLSGSGTVTVGGFAGSGNSIPVGSVGTIAIVTLRVTGAGYSDGHQSQLTINGYTDDIAGMTPQPAATTFTYRQ
ncbi:MAG: cohesin domain-containing protein [Candidatus Aminicenantales bacterium]